MKALCLAFLAAWTAAQPAPEPATAPGPSPADLVSVPELCVMGKWMCQEDGLPANWLGKAYRGKTFREPINIIVEDAFATSPQEAEARLIKACRKAGFPSRLGHSAGYYAFFAGHYFAQIPAKKRHAFADAVAEESNNHGRIFGPAAHNGRHFFVGAFSREKVSLGEVPHRYESINQARDRFARRMDERTDYKLTRFVYLDNVLLGDSELTTGDHDGMAAVLSAVR